MQLSDILLPRHVLPDVRVADKSALLRELSKAAGAALGIPVEAIASALVKREGLGSTGMGGGIAIPHARLAGLTKPFGLLARLDQGIDFDAVDGEPVDIVFPAAAPRGVGRRHQRACLRRAQAARYPSACGGQARQGCAGHLRPYHGGSRVADLGRGRGSSPSGIRI